MTWGVVESINGTAGDQTIILRHEPFASGYYTLCRHLENLQVSVGDDPRSGHLMGQFNTTENHLHFEWSRLSDLDPLFKKTVESTTDFSWLSRGDRVLIKIALNSGKRYPATTDPWSVHCMVKLLNEKGAGKILVGDQNGLVLASDK